MGNKRRKMLIRLVLVGNSNTGKTSLCSRYAMDQFNEQYKPTIAINTLFLTKEFHSNQQNITYHLQIWDTPGKALEFECLGIAFFRGFDGCLLIYDVTDQKSFDALDHWKQQFVDKLSEYQKENMPFVVVANKIDCNFSHDLTQLLLNGWSREFVAQYKLRIPSEITMLFRLYFGHITSGRLYAAKQDMEYYETSAKTGENVAAPFENICVQIGSQPDPFLDIPSYINQEQNCCTRCTII